MTDVQWRLKEFKISELTDYYKNPRQLTEAQYKQLKTSLDKFGLIDKPIVNIDAKHTVIGGHQRLNVLRCDNADTVECWIPDRELDEREIEELNIRLNKNTGGWDFDVLSSGFEFEDLIDWGFSEVELGLGIGVPDVEESDEIEDDSEDSRNDPKQDKPYFPGTGQYGIPEITAEYYSPVEWIPFNFAKTATKTDGVGIHFFLDDYQFVRLWNDPYRYINLLSKFDCVLSPDFSMFTSMPLAVQIFNHYRKHWLAYFYQLQGISVIPTISWSDESSFSWCFDGEPTASVVAVSTVGVMNNAKAKEHFMIGYNEMKRVLHPSKILCYGKLLPEIENEVEYIGCYYEKIRAESEANHGR